MNNNLRETGKKVSELIGKTVEQHFPQYHTHTKSGYIPDEPGLVWKWMRRRLLL
jgi:hypothetical protein